MYGLHVVLLAALLAPTTGGCGHATSTGEDSGTNLDTDTDTDTDSDTDSDADADSDTDADTDADTDTDSGTDTDSCFPGDYTIADEADAEALALYDCVTGDLVVTAPELVVLNLPSLEWIGNSLKIVGNPLLETVIIENLVSVGGDLLVGQPEVEGGPNPLLAQLDLTALSLVTGDLVVYDEASLENLVGLSSLSHVSGNVGVGNNTVMSKLEGLESLGSIGKGLVVWSNPALQSLDGLSSLTSIGYGYGVDVADNASLPQCEVCELLDQLDPYAGTFDSWGNQPDTCADNCL